MVGRTHLLTSGSRFLPGLTKGKGHTMTREITTSTRTPKRARGTVSYEDQTISTRAIALLAGAQHASIDVYGAGQDGARLSLIWGTLLLGFTAVDQVDALAEAFADSQSAAKRIPERLDPTILSAEIGDEAYLPAISVGFREVPRYGVSTHTLGCSSACPATARTESRSGGRPGSFPNSTVYPLLPVLVAPLNWSNGGSCSSISSWFPKHRVARGISPARRFVTSTPWSAPPGFPTSHLEKPSNRSRRKQSSGGPAGMQHRTNRRPRQRKEGATARALVAAPCPPLPLRLAEQPGATAVRHVDGQTHPCLW